jgi:hypothetical protein
VALDFPASPTVGDIFQGWQWDGVKWVAVGGGGGGIPDAPNDGTLYGRKSLAWSNVSHNDITDWAANVPAPSATNPIMDGVAAPGVATAFARGDHVHPSDTSKANVNGVTFTGRVFLANDPAVTAPLEAADGRYVLTTVPGENKLINSDMRIDQRNGGAAVNNILGRSWAVDRWSVNGSAANIFSAQRLATGGPAGFPYFVRLTSLAATTLAATDANSFFQTLEADTIADMGFGAAGASPWCLQFWVRASFAGVYSGSICNNDGSRTYPFSFTILTANTWQKITIQNQAGDTAATWVGSGSALGMYVRFDLGSGTSRRSTQGTWQASNFIGVTGAQSLIAANGRTLDFTGIKFETGLYCTTYMRQSLAKSMVDCQRYFSQVLLFQASYQVATGSFGTTTHFPVPMRAAPTCTLNGNNNNANVSGFTVNSNTAACWCPSSVTATATGGCIVNYGVNADAEL